MAVEFEEVELDSRYRHIPGWKTVRPPAIGYIVMARKGDAAPDYNPYGPSRPIIIDPGTEFERMFDPTKGKVFTKSSAPANEQRSVVGPPSLFKAVGSVSNQTTQPPAPFSGDARTTFSKRKVELEVQGSPFITVTSFHDIIEVSDGQKITHLVFVWNNNDQSDRVRIEGRLNTKLAVHMVGDNRIFVCDITNPIVFTFNDNELCVVPVAGEAVYGND